MNTKNSSIHTKKYRLILSAVHMVYRLVNSTYNVQELTLRLTRLLCQFIKASSSTIYLLDARKNKIILKASFDNKINILLTRKNDLRHISEAEERVTRGYEIYEPHLIGLPLVADDNVGAVFVRRQKNEPPFKSFDKDMLAVVAEQSVTAMKNRQLYDAQQKIILESIQFIGKLLDRHDQISSAAHTAVYFKIAKSLGEKLNMSQEELESLYYASILHDAGLINLPYEILEKTTRLTPEEWKIIRTHPEKGVELIRPVKFLEPVLPIILYHHEKYDGTGYPAGLKREQIPLGARIMAVVDAFETMTRGRPYKHKLSIKEALAELEKHSGTQFDPNVVLVFIELCRQKKFKNYLSFTIH